MPSGISPFSRFLDIIVLIALSALQYTFVMGLPWFDNGLWPQVEGPSSAIHLVSAILALGVGIQLAIKNQRYISAFCSPVILALFAFALLGACLVPFSGDFVRSLQGTMKHGIGVIWHFEMAVAALAAAALWGFSLYRKVIVAAALLAAVSVVVMYVFPESPVGTPLAFPEWSGMLALAVGGVVVIAGTQMPDDSKTKTLPFGYWAAGLALVAAGYWVSENRTVLLCVVSVGAYLCAAKIPVLRSVVRVPAARALTVLFMAIAISAAIYAAAPLIERTFVVEGVYAKGVGSSAPIDSVAIHDGPLGTIWSRSYLERVQIMDMIENSTSFLTGGGFGRFATAYERHARDVPGRMFAYPHKTASRAYWDAHTSANFHSHNMLSETLASVGIFGAVVWLSAFALMATRSVGGAAVGLGMIVVGSFWFPLNHMIGSLALLTGAVAGTPATGKFAKTVVSGLGSLLAILGLFVFGYTGVASATLAALERSERGFPAIEVDPNTDTCGFIRTNMFPEEEVVIDLYTILQTRVLRSDNPAKEMLVTTTNAISINCMLRRYYEQEGSIRALSASLKGRTALVQVGPASFGAIRNEIVKWGDDLERMLDAVPSRTELVTPYIATLVKRVPHKTTEEVDRFLPRLQESDPVRHHLLALRAGAAGDEAARVAHMERALALGFANLWPVAGDKVLTWN